MRKIKRKILLTPGPATTTDAVKLAMAAPDICPREEEFCAVLGKIRKDLVKIVKGGSEYISVLFAGSGTSMVDSVINSVTPPGKKIAVAVNGAYGERMVKIAESYRIPCVRIDFEWTKRVDIDKVNEILKKDRDISCLAVVHHETTTGVLNPIYELGDVCKKNNRTFIVDAVSSYAGMPIDIRKSSADFLISTSCKCIQGASGCVFAVCKKTELEKSKNYPPRSFYLNLYMQYEYLEKTGQTAFTPPVPSIYALNRAIKEYFKEGGGNRYKRYTQNWKILRQGLLNLGFDLLLKEEEESHILLTVLEPKSKNYSFKKMHDFLYKKGFTVYPGKIDTEKTFRLANMGDITSADINKFLVNLRSFLKRYKIKL